MFKDIILLITPPFTQLNTPYPATAYLNGFLKEKGYNSAQEDLGLDIILNLFSAKGLTDLFSKVALQTNELSENANRILRLKEEYINTVDVAISFLQDKDNTVAQLITNRDFLPEASRFDQLEEEDWAFGNMGIRDHARHLATLYLEDIGDLIIEAVDDQFGFSRYAEKLAMSASSFDMIYERLIGDHSYIDKLLIEQLQEYINDHQLKVVAFTVPFPGNLYSALKAAQYIKKNHKDITVIMGGGYVNTELRKVEDKRLFEFVDFMTLDDGEAPIEIILEFLAGNLNKSNLKRTFCLDNGAVTFFDNSNRSDYKLSETGTPDYSGLKLSNYLSVIEVTNPMHRLWTDGRWNKMTLAHGCYWGKCTFCDTSLDYISNYQPVSVTILCDRIEAMIADTEQRGFHFVDEAVPPALLRDLALEILKRKVNIAWWTNIRFEKSFTYDLCKLLKKSGCIAVSGGLEVASDRLLHLIQKGVSVSQVAKVTHDFTEGGIMVHAYLMYGFPTQTKQETIDSLEMVRQLFIHGTIQSAYWHRFSMTAHSPVGLNPAAYDVIKSGPEHEGFAENDLWHEDPKGCDHDSFGEGLRASLYNYMHGVGFDTPLKSWFDFKTPPPTVPKKYIEKAIQENPERLLNKPHNKLFWVGGKVYAEAYSERVKGRTVKGLRLIFEGTTNRSSFTVDKILGSWIVNLVNDLNSKEKALLTISEIEKSFPKEAGQTFQQFILGKYWQELNSLGLLML